MYFTCLTDAFSFHLGLECSRVRMAYPEIHSPHLLTVMLSDQMDEVPTHWSLCDLSGLYVFVSGPEF